MKNIAIILAGGSGSRFGADMPKQFLQVAGKMIIEHTIDAFERHPLIDKIAIVSRADYMEEMKEMVKKDGYMKVTHILQGGKERYHSSLSAAKAFTDDDDNLLIHDGVRPLVSERIITDCVNALAEHEAVDVAVATTDTIIELNEDGKDSAHTAPPIAPQCADSTVFPSQGYRRGFPSGTARPRLLPHRRLLDSAEVYAGGCHKGGGRRTDKHQGDIQERP